MEMEIGLVKVMFRKILLLVLVILSISTSIFAQDVFYHGHAIEKGNHANLPNFVLHAIFQDAKVWVATTPMQIGYVASASDAAASDNFGRSVAIADNGTIMVVGAWKWEGGASNQGGVYTFDASGTEWIQRATVLVAGDGAIDDLFGYSVAMNDSGTVLFVGASQWEGGATNQGGVYVYDASGTDWIQRGSVLTAGDAGTSDNFGSGVATNRDASILAVGAWGWDDSVGDRGAFYIFDASGTTYVQRGSAYTHLLASATDMLGLGMAMSKDGRVLCVAAPKRDNGGTDRGTLYSFDASGTTFVQRDAGIQEPTPTSNNVFGQAVALDFDASVLAVGAPMDTWGGLTNAGMVYIYDASGTDWVVRSPVATATDAGTWDQFGSSLALSNNGEKLIIGAMEWTHTAINYAGGVYTFRIAE